MLLMDGCTPIKLCELFTAEWLTALGTVGAVIVALALALWGEKIGRLFNRPRLFLEAHVGRPASVSVRRQRRVELLPLKPITRGGTFDIDAGIAYYFRLAIRNGGNTDARDVQVFLENVERIPSNGSPEKIVECTPMNLLWSNRGNATLPALLPEMPPVYCDFVHVEAPMPGSLEEQPDGQLVLDVEFPSNTGDHVLAAGTYRFGITLAAANHKPLRYKLEVIFSGTWYAQEEKMFDVGFKMRAI
jgi:hypothetical protein